VRRDLKDWCITKELALDRREWKLAIHVPEPYLRFLPFIAFCQVFFPATFRFFDLAFYCLFSFFYLVFLSPFVFPLFFALILYLFFFSCNFISSLPQLAWE
jgi:hypothetical protein